MLSAAKAYVSAQAGRVMRRAARNAVLLALAALLVLLALLFALFALYLYGAAEIGAVPAAAAMAGGLVVLALVLMAVVRFTGRRAPRRQPVKLDQALADDAVAALGLDDPERRKRLLYQGLAAAVLAGFYAGRKAG